MLALFWQRLVLVKVHAKKRSVCRCELDWGIGQLFILAKTTKWAVGGIGAFGGLQPMDIMLR